MLLVVGTWGSLKGLARAGNNQMRNNASGSNLDDSMCSTVCLCDQTHLERPRTRLKITRGEGGWGGYHTTTPRKLHTGLPIL